MMCVRVAEREGRRARGLSDVATPGVSIECVIAEVTARSGRTHHPTFSSISIFLHYRIEIHMELMCADHDGAI